MIRGIFRLTNDVTARAGEFLLVREDGHMQAVSPESLEALFEPKAETPNRRARVLLVPVKPPKAFGHYKTASALAAAQRNGVRLGELSRARAEKRRQEKLAQQAVAAE